MPSAETTKQLWEPPRVTETQPGDAVTIGRQDATTRSILVEDLLTEVVFPTFSNAWADITGKPSTFPPSTHSHVQAEVTNLVADLAAKAPLASPTFTGSPAAPTAAAADNTTKLATTAFVQQEIAAKAPLASPTFTGTPAAPTVAGTSDSTTKIATTAFVQNRVAALVASSPAALDTLNELATALGNDAAFSTTVTNALAAKAPLVSPALTGTPTAPTATPGTSNTQLATTAFVQASNGAFPDGFVNATLSASVAGNALTINLLDGAGATPSAGSAVKLFTRSATLANGTYDTLSIAAAASITIPSGATLGIANGAASRIWIVGFNDGGTFRLGVTNCWDGATLLSALDEASLRSSTAISAGATSAGVIYTGTAATTKAFRILGYVEYSTGLATAGTYASAPQIVQLFGPGIKKPGDVVKIVTATIGTTSSTTSSSFFDTAATASITPNSPANIAEVTVQGVFDVGASAVHGYAQVRRGTTNIGFQADGYGGTSGELIQTVIIGGFDLLNSASAVAYVVSIKNSNGSTTVYFPFGSAVFTIKEIMR